MGQRCKGCVGVHCANTLSAGRHVDMPQWGTLFPRTGRPVGVCVLRQLVRQTRKASAAAKGGGNGGRGNFVTRTWLVNVAHGQSPLQYLAPILRGYLLYSPESKQQLW